MAYDYDALYKSTPDALGDPTTAIVAFFEDRDDAPLRVLDVGCGQGRDALFIARLGHRVVGVDTSPNGIRDLVAAATREALPVVGVVADITTYRPEGVFDVLLCDRTLHMLDEMPRLQTLSALLAHAAPHAWLLIEDEASNIAGFEKVIAEDAARWDVLVKRGGRLFLRRV